MAAVTANVTDIENQLQRLRLQSKSKLANQQQASATLLAIEETLKEQNAQPTPAAYFGSLVTLLEQQRGSDSHSGLCAAVLYILDIILRGVPEAVLRTKRNDTVKVLQRYLDPQKNDAPFLRAAAGCMASVLPAQEVAIWNQHQMKQAFQALVLLAVDARPKVRKDAQAAVAKALSTVTDAKSDHPAVILYVKLCNQLLKDCARAAEPQTTIHVLTLVRLTLPSWPQEELASLSVHLNVFASRKHPFITKTVIDTLGTLADHPTLQRENEKYQQLTMQCVRYLGNCTDSLGYETWLSVTKRLILEYLSDKDHENRLTFIQECFGALFPNLEMNTKAQTQKFAIEALLFLVQDCIPTVLPSDPVDQPADTALGSIVETLQGGLGYGYHDSLPQVFVLSAALYRVLGKRATPSMDKLLRAIAALRMQSDFDFRDEADVVIKAAVVSLGPQQLLRLLPLNLDPETANQGDRVGRAWLLPLLKDSIQNAPLACFVDNLLPMADHLEAIALRYQNNGRDVEAKIYRTLWYQTWALLPSFCNVPDDVPLSFTAALAERLSDVLYTTLELRPVLCTSFQHLIRGLLRLSKVKQESTEDDAAAIVTNKVLSPEAAQQSLTHLAKYATDYLGVMFNVFSSATSDSHGYLLETIKVFLEITPADYVDATFAKVDSMLSQELTKVGLTPDGSKSKSTPSELSPLAQTMLNLSVAMIPFVSKSSLDKLLPISITLLTLDGHPLIQKKGYKILQQILVHPTEGKGILQSSAGHLLPLLLDEAPQVSSAAKKDRLRTLLAIVKSLSDDQLHWIPAILSESIMGTKEISERSRHLAYQLSIEMAQRMKRGGTISQTGLASLNDDGEMDTVGENAMAAQASLDEYFKMVTAGLTSSSNTMISATLSTLASLLFEFNTELTTSVIASLLETAQLFTSTQVPEIAKAGFGLTKAAVLTLPAEQLVGHLPAIMQTITFWSSRHQIYLKARAKHLVERLIRKFGVDQVEAACPQDHLKLIANIMKRKKQAKLRTRGYIPAEKTIMSTSAVKATANAYANAYEQAVYGSDSEYDTDASESSPSSGKPSAPARSAKSADKANNRMWIREDGEGPVDLLDDSVHTKVTGTDPTQRRQPMNPSARAKFQMNEDGRFVVQDAESDSSDDETNGANQGGVNQEAENYYLEATTSKDGFTRTKNNRIKFNKRKANDKSEQDGVGNAMDDDEPNPKATDQGSKNKKRQKKGADSKSGPTVGKDYRSQKGNGDVKKAGKLDPFAYVPLDPRRKGKPSIMGKRGKAGRS
ncbi:pre-rRNA processing protein [Dispira parvispora]|uniref:Pre-rRNA processing protein n=1 Tax=Dispira parvispora TaxID=1520584 RepID=A0A9W8E8Q1_9FUNG|nr:pre-rRNA processing protein [Dispira parvispora]